MRTAWRVDLKTNKHACMHTSLCTFKCDTRPPGMSFFQLGMVSFSTPPLSPCEISPPGRDFLYAPPHGPCPMLNRLSRCKGFDRERKSVKSRRIQ